MDPIGLLVTLIFIGVCITGIPWFNRTLDERAKKRRLYQAHLKRKGRW